MSVRGLGFVTHWEVDALLGGGAAGGRQRRRLVKRGWLPEAPLIVADRKRLVIYPEFALSALVISGFALEGLRRPLERAAESAQQLYRSQSYCRFHRNLGEALQTAGSGDTVALAQYAAELDGDVFAAWRNEVFGCIDALAEVDVHLETAIARVAAVAETYVVEFGDRQETHQLEGAPKRLALGALVARDRVKVGSSVRDFLLPVPPIELISMVESVADEEEQLTRLLFDGLESHLRVLPQLGAAREPVDSVGLKIDMPWALLTGANSMSRSHVEK